MEQAQPSPYNYRWRKARATFLRKNPLCAECRRMGRVTAADTVDHIRPHRGDQDLFWDTSNWQSLCEHCHNAHKQRLEKSGTVIGCDANGLPIDPNHHWA